MQISIETTSGLERRLTISVPSESFEEEITERLNQAATRVRLPGFRAGKVPIKEVRRRFGPAVRAEVAGELMQSTFMEAIRQEDLAPAGSPNLEVVKMDPGIDFEFTATFEVFPVVEIGDLGKVRIRKPEAEITDQDVDDMVERLREQRKTWQAVERAAGEGDQVKLDFAGSIDGEPFDGGTGEDMTFVVGAGRMIEDFDQGVRGLAAGADSEFQATFPDDYQSEELRGKTATFAVHVKEVAESVRPELNDEFFKAFGIEEGGEAAFRADVRANMTREMEAAASNQIKRQVMDSLKKLHDIALPESMVSREIESLKAQMLQQFQMYGAQNQGGFDLPDDLFRDEAEGRVTVGLVVNEIVTSSGLKPDVDRVRNRIETMAAGYADPQQVINYYYGNAEQLQQIEMAVLEDQVVDHILERADVEIVPATYTEAINGAVVADLEQDQPAEGSETALADPAMADADMADDKSERSE